MMRNYSNQNRFPNNQNYIDNSNKNNYHMHQNGIQNSQTHQNNFNRNNTARNYNNAASGNGYFSHLRQQQQQQQSKAQFDLNPQFHRGGQSGFNQDKVAFNQNNINTGVEYGIPNYYINYDMNPGYNLKYQQQQYQQSKRNLKFGSNNDFYANDVRSIKDQFRNINGNYQSDQHLNAMNEQFDYFDDSFGINPNRRSSQLSSNSSTPMPNRARPSQLNRHHYENQILAMDPDDNDLNDQFYPHHQQRNNFYSQNDQQHPRAFNSPPKSNNRMFYNQLQFNQNRNSNSTMNQHKFFQHHSNQNNFPSNQSNINQVQQQSRHFNQIPGAKFSHPYHHQINVVQHRQQQQQQVQPNPNMQMMRNIQKNNNMFRNNFLSQRSNPFLQHQNSFSGQKKPQLKSNFNSQQQQQNQQQQQPKKQNVKKASQQIQQLQQKQNQMKQQQQNKGAKKLMGRLNNTNDKNNNTFMSYAAKFKKNKKANRSTLMNVTKEKLDMDLDEYMKNSSFKL